jgi:competence protein ComEA
MFNLTPQERQVIIFLSAAILIGVGIDFLVKKNSPLKNIISLDYNFGRININQADKDALMSLPGIGEKLAGRIIEYRSRHGGFREPEELKNIKGIVAYRYQLIKDLFYIRD